jgi:hypothetical protein
VEPRDKRRVAPDVTGPSSRPFPRADPTMSRYISRPWSYGLPDAVRSATLPPKMDSSIPACPICKEPIPSATPVVFDHGTIAHLVCYTTTEGTASLVLGFLKSRKEGERSCHTCLAKYLAMTREDTEKGVTVLRMTGEVVVEPAICSTCTNARVTIRLRKSTA